LTILHTPKHPQSIVSFYEKSGLDGKDERKNICEKLKLFDVIFFKCQFEMIKTGTGKCSDEAQRLGGEKLWRGKP
jgi:hypothetical protein